MRQSWLVVAALVLAVVALPTLAPEAEDVAQGEPSAPRVDVAREVEEPQDAGRLAGKSQDEPALQELWDAERGELLAEQQRTEAELAALRELNADLEDDRQIRWMLVGAGLVLVGLVLGVLIKSRPQRRDAWQ